MPKENDIKVRSIGKGIRLMIWSKGRWHSTELDTRQQVNKKNKLDTVKEKKARNVLLSNFETRSGGFDSDNPTDLSLTRMMSLCTTDTNKQYFTLDTGIAGQMKIIVHLTRTNSKDMKISFTIADGDAIQQFVSSSAPKTLLLFSDGTYWHPLGEFTGASDVGEWSMT